MNGITADCCVNPDSATSFLWDMNI
jgi:hypothetical protein